MLYRITIFLFLLLLSVVVQGQGGCNGNLGDNIFEAGDFGSGTDNILQTDPGIAPGYIYRTTPPPPDGEYVITNSLAQWSSRFDWPAIDSDNSDDPNGYMMVVNASNTPGKFYEQLVDGLCENTLYVFSADVMNIHPLGRNYIRPNVSFTIDGVTEFSTGDVPENGQWNTYGFTFTTGPSVTSVTLSLVNNAPGGIGNDLILDNIKFQACGPEALILPRTVENICEDGDPITLQATVNGDQYDDVYIQWQQSPDDGMSWQDIPNATELTFDHTQLNAGMYYYRYLLAGAATNLQNDKCRVNSNVKIVNVVPKFYTVIDTLCEGLTFSLGERNIGATGSYTESLKNVIGCDSVVTLELTILDDPGISANFNVIDPSCANIADGSSEVIDFNSGFPPISIYVESELSLNSGRVENLSNGDLNYTFEDRYGCTADTIITLIDPPEFTIDLGMDTTILLGDPVEINIAASEMIESITWNSELINCDIDCNAFVVQPLESASIAVMAFSADGCEATDVINITVEKLRQIYFANAFSPDGDGVNDLFTVLGTEPNILEVVELEIYDRWANLLFERANFRPNDPDLGWDGKFNNTSVNTGAYVYVARVRFLDDKVIQYSGVINVIR